MSTDGNLILSRRTLKGYGWKPSLPDRRDQRYAAPFAVIESLPPSTDLESQLPVPAYDQLRLSSCVGNASALAYRHEWIKETGDDFDPSRLWIYYQARFIEGDPTADNGCFIRDAFRALATVGVPPEDDWPYREDRVATAPPDAIASDAAAHLALRYLRVEQDPSQIKASLTQGYGVVLGIMVFEDFETAAVARSGLVPLPHPGEEPIGAHAVFLIGYDDVTRCYKFRNSWGPDWGVRGCFWLPYEYVHDAGLTSDLWSLRLVRAAPVTASDSKGWPAGTVGH